MANGKTMPAIVPTIGFCAALGIGLLVGLIAGLSGGSAPALLGATDFFDDSSLDHTANNDPLSFPGELLAAGPRCSPGSANISFVDTSLNVFECLGGQPGDSVLFFANSVQSISATTSHSGQNVAATYHGALASKTGGPTGVFNGIAFVPVSVSRDAGASFTEYLTPSGLCTGGDPDTFNMGVGKPSIVYTDNDVLIQTFTSIPQGFVGAFAGYAVSFDHGQTWPVVNATARSSGQTLFASQLTNARFSVHHTIVDFSCRLGGSTVGIYHTKSVSHGVTWSDPVLAIDVTSLTPGNPCQYLVDSAKTIVINEQNLLVAAKIRDGSFLASPTFLAVVESNDGGATWSPIRLTSLPTGICRVVASGVIITKPDLFAFFDYNAGRLFSTFSPLDCQVRVAYSDDRGQSWTVTQVGLEPSTLSALPAITTIPQANLIAVQWYEFATSSTIAKHVVHVFNADVTQRISSFTNVEFDALTLNTGIGFTLLEDWQSLEYNRFSRTLFSTYQIGFPNNAASQILNWFISPPPGHTEIELPSQFRVRRRCFNDLIQGINNAVDISVLQPLASVQGHVHNLHNNGNELIDTSPTFVPRI